MKNLPFKKLFKIVPFIFILGVFFSLSKPLFSPSNTEGANPPADIFTGQLIPAFIGAEYDPTLAFQELAGSTVYVFAYDNWGSTNPIVDNKVIKTQVRADGTFQAAGLPHANYYGVYFPYNEAGPIEGTPYNCGGTGDGPPYPYNDADGNPVSCTIPPVAQGGSLQQTPFRMVEDSDKIADVFSYAIAQYGSGNNNPQDQLSSEVGLNRNGGRTIFITSANRIDIENHVNIFPIIPTSVMNMRINTLYRGMTSVDDGPDDKIFASSVRNKPASFVATRIAYYRKPWPGDLELSDYLYTNGPTFSGKTDNQGVFKGYAPAGYYQIAYEFAGETAIAFKEIDPINENTGSHLDDITDTTIIDGSTWPSNNSNAYPVVRNGTYVWGVVTLAEEYTQSGFPRTAYTPVADIGVNILADSYVENGTEMQRDFDVVNIVNNGRTGTAGPYTDFEINYDTTNDLGLYFFKTSDVYSPITGDIKLVESDGALVGPPTPNGGSYEQQSTLLPGLNTGSYRVDFSLVEKPGIGFLLTVRDSNNVRVSGADVLVVSEEDADQLNSKANNSGGYKTDDKGEIYLSPYIFVQDASIDHKEQDACEDNILQKYVVIARKGDTFRAVRTLEIAEICDSFNAYTELEIARSTTNQTNEPGMVQLAQALHFNLNVQAEQASVQCYIMENLTLVTFAGGDPDEYLPKVPVLQIMGSINGIFSEDVIMMTLIDDNGNPFRSTPIKGVRTTLGVGVENIVYAIPGIVYAPDTGEAKLVLPCSPGVWTVKIEAGDSIIESATNNNDITLAEKATVMGDNIKEAGFKENALWGMVPGGIAINGALDTSKELKNQETRTEIILNRSLVGGNRRVGVVNVEIVDEGHDGQYQIDPSAVSISMKTDCPDISLLAVITEKDDLTIDDLIGSLACKFSAAVATMIEGIGDSLERTVLHTPPISSVPTVTYLWNTFRNIGNSIAIIMILFFAYRYMFRADSKDLPLKELPWRLVKAVLLANFSLLYCQIFIDVANISVRAIMNTVQGSMEAQIAAGGGPSSLGTIGGGTVVLAGFLSSGISAGIGAGTATAATAAAGGAAASGIAIAGPAILAGILAIGMSLLTVIITVFIQFIIRLTVIYICVVLAPIRFILGAHPATEGFTKLWDGVFYAFVFMQTAAALFLAIGFSLISYFPSGSKLGIQSVIQLLIGLGTAYIAIKSPQTLLGLMGGGGIAGKAMGSVSEGLGEKTGELKGSFSGGAIASRIGARSGELASKSSTSPGVTGIGGKLMAGLGAGAAIAGIKKPSSKIAQQALAARGQKQYETQQRLRLEQDNSGIAVAQGAGLSHVAQAEGGIGAIAAINHYGAGDSGTVVDIDTKANTEAGTTIDNMNLATAHSITENNTKIAEAGARKGNLTKQIDGTVTQEIESTLNQSNHFTMDKTIIAQQAIAAHNESNPLRPYAEMNGTDQTRVITEFTAKREAARKAEIQSILKDPRKRESYEMIAKQRAPELYTDLETQEQQIKTLEQRNAGLQKQMIKKNGDDGTARVTGAQLQKIAQQTLENNPAMKTQYAGKGVDDATGLYAATLAEGEQGGQVTNRQRMNAQSRRRAQGGGSRQIDFTQTARPYGGAYNSMGGTEEE